MTPEDIEELKEVLKTYKEADLFCGIMIGICLLSMILIIIWEIYRFKKIKQMQREWKSTLTEEQLKIIKKNNEYFK